MNMENRILRIHPTRHGIQRRDQRNIKETEILEALNNPTRVDAQGNKRRYFGPQHADGTTVIVISWPPDINGYVHLITCYRRQPPRSALSQIN